tara:strand:- start:383 stop:538 length:156 start_codon:yes stop_codon:yes gene_type:complete
MNSNPIITAINSLYNFEACIFWGKLIINVEFDYSSSGKKRFAGNSTQNSQL